MDRSKNNDNACFGLSPTNNKLEEILTCLEKGNHRCYQHDENDDASVDLWHLRQLALTKGGLLSSTVRKRAWPKLLGIHTQVLLSDHDVSSTTTTATTTTANGKGQAEVLEITQTDMNLLQDELSKPTVWNVQDYIIWRKSSSRCQEYYPYNEGNNKSNTYSKRTRQVTFAQEHKTSTAPASSGPANQATASHGDDSTFSSPASSSTASSTSTSSICSNTSSNDDYDDTSDDHGDQEETSSTTHTSTLHLLQPDAQPLLRARSPQEEAVLTNIIVSLLRTTPVLLPTLHADDDGGHDDDSSSSSTLVERYRYYSGLHNLASVLLITLESPSLCSLMLQKLVTYHLHPYVHVGSMVQRTRPSSSICMSMLLLTETLLYKVIAAVEQQDHSRASSLTLSSSSSMLDASTLDEDHKVALCNSAVISMLAKIITTAWIPSWFASQLWDLQVVSRLFDVLLVSHVTMPIYLSVALVAHYYEKQEPVLWQAIMTTTSSSSTDSAAATDTLESAMLRIPMLLSRDENATIVVEEVIATALQYIERFPPQALLFETVSINENTNKTTTNTRSSTEDDDSTSASSHVELDNVLAVTEQQAPPNRWMRSPPRWMQVSTAPSDWTLITHAKAVRLQRAASTDATNNSNEDSEKSKTESSNANRIVRLALTDATVSCCTHDAVLARIALGLPPRETTSRKRKAFVVAAIVLTLLAMTTGFLNHQGIIDAKRVCDRARPSIKTTTPLSSLLSGLGRTRATSGHASRQAHRKKKKRRNEAKASNFVNQPMTSTKPARRFARAVARVMQRHHESKNVAAGHEKTTAPLRTPPKWKTFLFNKQQPFLTKVQQWRQTHHLAMDGLSKLARKALVESEKLQWKGHRFLI